MNLSDRLSPAAAPFLVAALLFAAVLLALPSFCAAQYNTAPPAQPVRTVFIHHSVGENWLREDHGGLAPALYANNYHIHDTNYDWGPVDEDAGDANVIGNHTDIGHWYNWFLAAHRDTYLHELYTNERLTDGIVFGDSCADPGGENTVVLFKSCFVSATYISGSVGDPPLAAGLANPIHGIGMDVDAGAYTVSNIKGLYRDLLTYFATRQDKLFVLVTTPPSCPGEASPAMPLLRDINSWLVDSWLSGYAYNNVAVFDFSCVLTSNGGDAETNDLGAAGGSHHRFRNGAIEHITGPSPMLAYGTWDQGSSSWDNHPTPAGGQKATAEFLPLLNIAYNRWRGNTPTLPAAPVLVSPADSAADLSTAPTLVWTAVAGAQSYTAQLATNPSFSAGTREQSLIGGTQYVAAGLAAGTGYFWRIRAVNNAGSGPWSAVRFFTTAPETPVAPVPVSPANGSTGITPPVELAWSHGIKAAVFRLQLSADAGFSTLRLDTVTNGTSKTVAGLAPSTTYYWRSNATVGGASSVWSDVWHFTTAATVGIDGPAGAVGFRIAGVFPQPARGDATVQLETARAQRVTLTLHDALGRTAAVLYDGEAPAGTTSAALRAAALAPGPYLLRAAGDGAVATRPVMVGR